MVGDNEDLIAAAAKILKELPKQTLQITPDPQIPLQKFIIVCSGVDRIDLFVDSRPALSQEVSGNQFKGDLSLPFAAAKGSVVGAYGYRKGQLVVSSRLSAGS